ncbi:MAG TPA: peptidase [Candidatus Faecalibacterium faecipullorum]|uniref:Peptidase n=1 Tax=Candidatus Faecalibacterium faecipullorum TaxID=2838578 RepID=A0A9D2MEH7_9FIRM|nr:peptidase [Candidatus Faecalibacterium faecipullorum]
MDEHKVVVRRLALLIAASAAIFGLYALRLIFLQLVHGEEYAARATSTTEYRFNVTAARGDIVDSAGRRIATSTTCYNVVLSRLLIGSNDLNETIRSAVEILQAGGESWNDTLLIGYADGAGHYAFTGAADSERDQNAIAAVKEALGLQQYATADDVMERIVAEYELEGYDSTWQRILGGIRYQMEQEAFSNVNNFTLAENVSDRTVATVKEHSLTLPGVEIAETSVRSYTDGTILPHVLGRVGKITAEMWRVTDENGQVTYPLRDRGYAMNDVIGISGLESAYEEQLRGQDGVETITRDSEGVIIDTSITTEPQPGKTVMLTVNSEFQKAVDEALARNVQQIAATYNVDASAGAVVVIDVKNGGILACSNYPSYDQNLYSTQYSEYSSDPGLPLYNRALQGLYTPGSTYKPSVAIAALLSGVIDRTSTVYCNGVYNYFSDYHPRCTRHGHSGDIDVVTAIKWSCNIFFYDVGRRTTSDVYDDYAHRLGLGTPTGVEVSESTGRLTTKEDDNYTASLEVQAAIGQGNTVVTPVQLATYAATIANKGVRYRTHFVKALLDTNTGEVLEETAPEVVEIIPDEVGAFDIVEEGMVGAAQTVAGLANYPYTIACKTGTPQRSEYRLVNGRRQYYTNSTIIAYGPVEDPQIAVGIVVEYGGGGSRTGELVADIFNAYFFERSGGMTPVQEGQLLE